jgi:hypothetical protein
VTRSSSSSVDLVHDAQDPSIWRGPTLAWMSTEGVPYFILDNLEERELWDVMRVVTQVRALLPFVVGILCPLTVL